VSGTFWAASTGIVISFLPSSSIFYMSKPPLHALNGIGDFGTTTRPQLVLLRIDPSSPLCLFTRFCFILLPVPDPDAQPLACFLFSSFSDMRGRPLTALWPAPFLVSPFFWSAVRSPSVTGRVTEYESAARGRLRLTLTANLTFTLSPSLNPTSQTA